MNREIYWVHKLDYSSFALSRLRAFSSNSPYSVQALMTSLSTQEVVLASVFVCLLHPALTPSWQPPLSMLDLGASFT